jgi:hypothetical protein
MIRPLCILFFAALFATGCPTRPKVRADNNDSGATTDAGAQLVALQITSPTDGTYASGKVTVTVVTNVDRASLTVSLLDGQTLLANVVGSSPYTYAWDTTGVTEGPHHVVAQTIANGRSVISSSITINVDHTAPTVTATTPATGATNVVLRAPITVTFSEAILPASLTASGAVTLTVGGKAAPATTSLSDDGTTATIVPTNLTSIALPASCTVSFASSITDLAGNILVAPTPGWSWTVPEWVTFPSITTMTGSFTSGIGNPHLAITSDLRPALAYTDPYVDQSGVQQYAELLVQVFDGTAWRSLGNPSPTNLPNDQLGHFLTLDSDDHPVVVWSNGTTMSDFLYLSAWDGTAWGTATPPLNSSIGPPTNAIKPVVRMNTMGQPVVGWLELMSGGGALSRGDVFVATWTGAKWDKSLGGLGLSTPSGLDVTFSDAGNPVVGWLDGNLMGFSTWNGSTWTQSPSLSVVPSVVGRPIVAFDSESNPVMVATGPPTFFSIEELISGSWQQSIQNPTAVTNKVAAPTLAAGPDRNFSLAWVDQGMLNLARRTSSNQWDVRATTIAASNEPINSDFDFVVDAEGDAWLAWDDGKTMNVSMNNYPAEP